MKSIAFCSLKGGTGKSSLCILTGNYLAKAGARVLMIDFDMQNSLSFYYINNFDLVDSRNLALALQTRDLSGHILDSQYHENLKVIASSYNLIDLRAINEKTLIRLLPRIDDQFDYCLFDCPPTLDNIVFNALHGADLIISPCRLSKFDYKGLVFLKEKIDLDVEGLDKWKILINFFRPPRSDNEDNMINQYLSLFYGTFNNILDFRMPESVYIQKSIDLFEVISHAKNKEKVFNSFKELVGFITGNNFERIRRF
ncbi:MAG: ParA family protein [Spirochaetales bacterium]|nr:ParA family protein [Spirochaetales bacterium]